MTAPLLTICAATIAAREAYSAGWAAGEAWHTGQDAPTRAPRHLTTPERDAWEHGFADAEAYLEGE